MQETSLTGRCIWSTPAFTPTQAVALKRLGRWLDQDEPFMFTYGDGVADVDLRALLKHHLSHGKLATVTAVRAPARFGRMGFDGQMVREFYEKPEAGEGWINGGYFILEKRALTTSTATHRLGARSARASRAGGRVGRLHACRVLVLHGHSGEKNMLEELFVRTSCALAGMGGTGFRAHARHPRELIQAVVADVPSAQVAAR